MSEHRMATKQVISGTIVDGSNRQCRLMPGIHLQLPLGLIGFQFERPTHSNSYKLTEEMSISLDASTRFRVIEERSVRCSTSFAGWTRSRSNSFF